MTQPKAPRSRFPLLLFSLVLDDYHGVQVPGRLLPPRRYEFPRNPGCGRDGEKAHFAISLANLERDAIAIDS